MSHGSWLGFARARATIGTIASLDEPDRLPKPALRVNRLPLMRFARGSIDADAEKVVRKLARSGHQAYLVGGCVRDLLLDRTPKDFDVATSATPSEIRDLFRNCRIIGRRFRLAHIFFGSKIIETSTFRAKPSASSSGNSDLLIRRDNVFGSDTEDARRRDFTINGLFYDVETGEIIDHVGGMDDLEARLVRTIGTPGIRFQEDPVRMLRAVKFAARLDFAIERDTRDAIVEHRGELAKCSPPRVLEEFYRLLRSGAARRSLELLNETGLDEVLSPRLAAMFRATPQSVLLAADTRDEEEASWHAIWADEGGDDPEVPLQATFATATELQGRREVAWRVLEQLDQLFHSRTEMSNPMLLAAILNPFLAPSMRQPGVRPAEANAMILELAQPLLDELRVSRRDSERMRQTLLAQRRLLPSRRRRGHQNSLVRRDYFLDALEVFEATATAAGESLEELAYWRQLSRRRGVHAGLDAELSGRRRRRRGGRRRRREPDEL